MRLDEAIEKDIKEGATLYEKGDYKNAIVILEEFIQRYGKNIYTPRALYLEGRCFEELGQTENAKEYYKKIFLEFPATPYSSSAIRDFFRISFTTGDISDSIEILNKIDAISTLPLSDKAFISYVKGRHFMKEGRYGEAISSFLISYRNGDKTLMELSKSAITIIARDYLDIGSIDILKTIDEKFVKKVYLETKLKEEIIKNDIKALEGIYKEYINLVKEDEIDEEIKNILLKAKNILNVRNNRIGVVLPLSGKFSNFGIRALKGIEIALGVYNKENKESTDLELVIKDTAGIPEKTAKSIEELVFDENVIAIIGPLLESEMQALDMVDTLQVPIITFSKREDITLKSDNLFRFFISSREQASTLVSYCTDFLGLNKFAILYPNDRYGIELRDMFWDEVLWKGGKIMAVEGYEPNSTDFSNAIKKMVGTYYVDTRLDEKPDDFPREKKWEPPPIVDFEVLFIPDTYKAVSFIAPHLAYNNVTGILLAGTNLWNDDRLTTLGGKEIEGAIFVDAFFKDAMFKETQSFVMDYRGIFGEEPDIISAHSDDAMKLSISILKKNNIRTRAELKKHLSEVINFHGVTGNITINEKRGLSRTLFILEVKNGKIIQALPVENK